ncbi:hypothetical protein THAOC_23948, partial [Thalassiosira oceanica]
MCSRPSLFKWVRGGVARGGPVLRQSSRQGKGRRQEGEGGRDGSASQQRGVDSGFSLLDETRKVATRAEVVSARSYGAGSDDAKRRKLEASNIKGRNGFQGPPRPALG